MPRDSMRWLLRLGLGGDNNTRTSYDRAIVTPPMQYHAAIEIARRTADAMLEFAISRCLKVKPLVLGGEKFATSYVKADFSARVLACAGEFDYLAGERPSTWKIDPKDWPAPGVSDAKLGKVDIIVGPSLQELQWALALGAGKAAVDHGIERLSKVFHGRMRTSA